jgi:hypothetical protein
VELQVEVPVNTTAEITIGAGETVTAGSGSYQYKIVREEAR